MVGDTLFSIQFQRQLCYQEALKIAVWPEALERIEDRFSQSHGPWNETPLDRAMTEQSRLVGYFRVSKTSQNPDIQIDALTAAGCRKIFLDKSSGKRWSRKGLKDALAHIRPGDHLVVWKVDRIGRSALPILTILDKLQQRGASLLSLSENCDSGTQNGRIQCLFLAIMAEIEGVNITIRTQAGVDAAASRGRHRGGHAKLTTTQIDQAARMMERGMSAKSVALEYQIGRATLFRHLKASRDMMLAR